MDVQNKQEIGYENIRVFLVSGCHIDFLCESVTIRPSLCGLGYEAVVNGGEDNGLILKDAAGAEVLRK